MQKNKHTWSRFLQNCDEFPFSFFFFFFCSILRRWESFPAFNKLPDFWLDSWSHNTYLYISMLAEIFSQKYVRVCMCMTVLKNLVDAKCYRWFNSWVLTFREEKKTWNIKQLPNVKIMWVKDIIDICKPLEWRVDNTATNMYLQKIFRKIRAVLHSN